MDRCSLFLNSIKIHSYKKLWADSINTLTIGIVDRLFGINPSTQTIVVICVDEVTSSAAGMSRWVHAE
jgi:hypothetical protein